MKNLKNKNKQSYLNNIDHDQKPQKPDDPNQSPYYDNVSAIDLKGFISSSNHQKHHQQPHAQVYAPPSSASLQPSILEYKLQKLLHESQKREEEYQTYIKKKHEQSYEMTQNYLKSLKKYKEELDKYVEEKNKKKQAKFTKYQSSKVLNRQLHTFSTFNKQKLQVYYPSIYSGKQNTTPYNHKINLKCVIGLKAFTPLVEDYLKQKFPLNLNVEIKLPIKTKYMSGNQKADETIQVTVRTDEDESQNIENLIYGYPFSLVASGDRNGRQVAPRQGQTMKYEFTILNEQENLENIDKGKVWINIYNRDSQMLWAYSSFPADQLLYYHKESTLSRPIVTQQTQIIEFFCPYSHKKNCLFQFRIEIEPSYVQENGNRVQSNEPMELAKIHIDRNLYGDKYVSIQIKRINKFKTATNSLIMRPDAHYLNKQADKQEYFKNSNDKTLIQHRKRKQLQSINKFKEEHKPELMQKLFDQALQKYSLQDIQIGSPKYLPFYFQKPHSGHQRIHSSIILKLNGNPKFQQQLMKQIQVQLIDKKLAQSLVTKGLIKIKQHATTDIQVLSKQPNNRTTLDIYDKRVVLIVKVLIYPTVEMEQVISQGQNKLRCDICLRIDSEDNQLLSQQVFKLKPIPINTEYQLTLHNYEYQHQQISLPLNISPTQKDSELQSPLNSLQVIASTDVEYRISNAKDVLDLKLKFPKLKPPKTNNLTNNLRQVQITLLDGGLNFVVYSFRIKLFTYHRMKEIPQYFIGSICKYTFNLEFDEQIPLKQSGTEKSLTKKAKSALVAFYTSHPNQSTVFCQSKNQLIVQDNQIYPIEVNYQSFSMDKNQDRVLIHMIDLNSNEVLKRWLLKISKTFEDYRSVNQVKVQKNKLLKYDYLLKNRTSSQRSFKFFCSNHSIIQVPEYPVLLSENQQTKVQLSIIVKKQDLTVEQKQKGIEVIIRVEQSSKEYGWNELFRVLIN